MANVVKGSDCLIEAYIDGDFLAFACPQEMTFSEEADIIEATTATSTKARDFKGDSFYTWRISCSGVFFLKHAGKYVFFSLFANEVRANGLLIRITFTDTAGSHQEIVGTVLFPSKSITATAGSLTKWMAEMQGTGEYEISELIEGSTPGAGIGSMSIGTTFIIA